MANLSEKPQLQPVSTADTAPDPALGSKLGGMRKIAPRQGPGRLKRRRGTSVKVLKVTLPVIMLVTMGYLGYWWWQSRDSVVPPDVISPIRPTTEKAEVTVQDVQYDGKDDRGRPFSITAVSASHVDGDDRHISLKKPLADIVLASGAYVALTANDGMLDRDTDIITLNGDVTLFHDNGLSFQTDSATINMKQKTAEGDDVVEGQNGDGELVSEGFRVRDDGDTIEFTGKVYVKIYPKQKDKGG
jgi:lipopolysaccharide export system protein LptC